MNKFINFPKTRPTLPYKYERIYKSQYKENREGRTIFSSLSLKAESWQHIKAAKDVLHDSNQKSTLEIGAGTLNHLPYEPTNNEYDIIEPYKELYKKSPLLKRVRNIYADISEIATDSKYDRIVSCNVFEHICDLPTVVARCGALLKKDGMMRIGIPSEGTILWKISWMLTRGIEFKIQYGLNYNVLMKYEHVNTAKEIEEVLKYFFARVHTKVMGLSRTLSLYQFHVCSFPYEDRCIEYLDYIKNTYISARY